MKKYIALLLVFVCVFCFFGCGEKTNTVSREIRFVIPAGSNQLIFDEESMYFADGTVKISADYEGAGLGTVVVWFSNTEILHAYEGNPYTNAVVEPNSVVEVEVDGGAWYQIAVQLVPNDSEQDIPVVITVQYETSEN